MAGGRNSFAQATRPIGFGLIWLFAQLAALPASADELDRLHQTLIHRKDLQFDFAKMEATRPPPSPNWLSEFLHTISPFLNVLFWGALGVGVLTLLWFIGREVWITQRARSPKLKTGTQVQRTDWRPAPEVAQALLADADRLAQEGRFDEAARTLLHRSIADIEQKVPQTIKKAQTSREISRLPVLPPPVASAFAPLIRAVEQSWFGGRPLDAAAYQVCRRAYADFALSENWARAPA